jgi:exosortase A
MSTLPMATPARFGLTHGWQRALLAVVLLQVWILFLYRETAMAMVTIWSRSDTFTHGFLVPPIVLWLIWRRREALTMHVPRPAPAAWVLMAGVAFIWLLGDLVAVNAVTQLMLVALLVLSVPALLGWSITRQIIFPLGFLFFAVPIGEFLLPPLMEWTAHVTVFALRLSGIPVYREGLDFVVPTGRWAVVEACSGVRYLIASLTVGALFSYMNYQSAQRRILFVLVALVVPVVANWMRAYMIVMLGHLSGNKLAVGVDHLLYGWVFFGIVIMLMFIIGSRWAEPESTAPMATQATGKESRTTPRRAVQLWGGAAGMAMMVTLPHLAVLTMENRDIASRGVVVAPASLVTHWQADAPKGLGFKPAFQNPSTEINQHYSLDGRAVGLYLGHYQHQDYGRKLVSSNNVLVVGKDPHWELVASGRQRLIWGEHVLEVRTAELRSVVQPALANQKNLVAWQFYWIGGQVTANDHLAKVYGALNRLSGRSDGSAVIVASTLKDQTGDADSLLTSFLTTHQSAINDLLLAMGKSPG